MTEISLSENIQLICPDLRLGAIQAKVSVSPSSELLLNRINASVIALNQQYSREDISSIPVIREARTAYKALGKDPSRYRLSAEALLRRVLSGKGLYKINNVVDLLNLVSIQSGFSIGGYDLDKVKGKINFGVGQANEPYEAIGRGVLNIEFLPVLRDGIGPFGSPTSDSVRTSVTAETTNFLIIFFDFAKNQNLESSMKLARLLLFEFAEANIVRELCKY